MSRTAGNLAHSLEVLVDGNFSTSRIPHLKDCHANGMDGRIDDPKAGWKGGGVWSAYAGPATNHIEGGKGTKPKVMMQVSSTPVLSVWEC